MFKNKYNAMGLGDFVHSPKKEGKKTYITNKNTCVHFL